MWRVSGSRESFESAAVKIKLHPEAEEELLHGAAWYDTERPGLGDEFLEHVNRWFNVVLGSPNGWPRWFGTPDALDPPVRRVVLDRFPYSLGYQAFSDHVLIVTVAHASREPFFWLRRTSG